MSNSSKPGGTKPGNREFYSQLEGLRGVAVFLVMISHFVVNPYLPQYQNLAFGFWGVNLFFVLSGFLITEILLNDVYNELGRGPILKKFYIRRTLRIFPIYYLSILVLYFANAEGAREATIYAATYTYNWYNFLTGEFVIPMSHFWSLCVEEQFYLIWPMLLIITPPRHHLKLIILMLAIGFGSRLLYVGLHMENYSKYVYTTPACFDCLGMGALLAWLKINRPEVLRRVLKPWAMPVVFVALGILVCVVGHEFFYILGMLFTAIVGFYLIGNGSVHKPTYFGKMLNNGLLRFTGKISYGVYVYHWILFTLFHDAIAGWLRDVLSSIPGLAILKYNVYIPVFIVMVLFTLAVSYVSFTFIELPVMRLRGYFEKPRETKITVAE